MDSHILWIRLKGDLKFIEECIVILFKEQTDHEQESWETRETNGVGFTKGDAAFMSSCAEKIISGTPLHDLEIDLVTRKMPKYAKQLSKHFTE